MIGRRVAALYRRVKPPNAVKAGVDRWPVKTGADPDAAGVSLIPVPTTIQALRSLTPPARPTGRVSPTEFTVYSVPCRITLWKSESDGDHHLVLSDDGGNTIIGEIPDPALVAPASPWLLAITACRQAFDAAPPLGAPVVVSGVLFMDHLHGQTGVAPNGVEIHPILSITPAS